MLKQRSLSELLNHTDECEHIACNCGAVTVDKFVWQAEMLERARILLKCPGAPDMDCRYCLWTSHFNKAQEGK